MKFSRAFGWSTIMVLLAVVGVLSWGLTSGAELNLPLLFELDSSAGAGGTPETELSFSPFVPLLVILVLGGSLWVGSRASRSRSR